QFEVEVFGHRLVAGGEGQPEADLGSGREPLGVGEGQSRAAESPFPHAGHVTVRSPPDLAQLAEAHTNPHRATPVFGTELVASRPLPFPKRVGRSVTGTVPPVARSWPVPWLPPAGGVAEATMCSMPYPVQAP